MFQNEIDILCVFFCVVIFVMCVSVFFLNLFPQFIFTMKKHFYRTKREYFWIVNKYQQFKYMRTCFFFETRNDADAANM